MESNLRRGDTVGVVGNVPASFDPDRCLQSGPDAQHGLTDPSHRGHRYDLGRFVLSALEKAAGGWRRIGRGELRQSLLSEVSDHVRACLRHDLDGDTACDHLSWRGLATSGGDRKRANRC